MQIYNRQCEQYLLDLNVFWENIKLCLNHEFKIISFLPESIDLDQKS